MKPPEFGQPELSNNESEVIHNIKHVGYYQQYGSSIVATTSCYLVKHNIVIAPKAGLTYLSITQA
jgi:hypothetical protein